MCSRCESLSCRFVSVVVGGWALREGLANARDWGASSHSGQVWQETAGRRRCYPLIRGCGVEERRREEELRGLSGLEKAGVSDCRGHTDTEKGGGGVRGQIRRNSFHTFPLTKYSLFRASMCKSHACTQKYSPDNHPLRMTHGGSSAAQK